ncbi:MAG: DUF4433 domain-containing protein [Deltaproteobacteria bacterium]|nr:DUF4433 domain-containing protein [Deltaproteobacteria bacterium]
MSPPPATPCVYHITHVNNLPAIIANGGLISDAAIIARGGPAATIGMGTIKQRRLSLPVSCHPGLNVGDCVPFYFCPRSIMLYVIHCANHPELSYLGGQESIVHLEADLGAVVAWANLQKRRWAFSLSNAGASYTQFRKSLNDLHHVDWDAVASHNFSNGSYTPSGHQVKEGKQAEFLLHSDFPWVLFERIGVASRAIAIQAQEAIANAAHKPQISVQPSWYF